MFNQIFESLIGKEPLHDYAHEGYFLKLFYLNGIWPFLLHATSVLGLYKMASISFPDFIELLFDISFDFHSLLPNNPRKTNSLVCSECFSLVIGQSFVVTLWSGILPSVFILYVER